MGSDTSAEQKTEKIVPKTPKTPKEYICPLTNKIMANPTMIPMTGIVYDKVTLRRWFQHYSIDPMTGIGLIDHRANGNDEKSGPKQRKHKLITNPRRDIEKQIKLYLELYPQKKQDQMTEDCDINWKKIFEERINNLKSHQRKFEEQDVLIKYKSFALFQREDDEKSNIKRNELFIRDDIPIITFMGPNRCGKSTLLNDIMGGQNVFDISHDPMNSCTMGAHITRYMQNNRGLQVKYWLNEIVKLPEYFLWFIEHRFDDMTKISKITQQDLIKIGITRTEHQTKLIENRQFSIEEEGKAEGDNHNASNEFYLVDVEGSSHQVTEFTTKMFYAVYAISNVIIWNDLQIAPDAFKNLMKGISSNMKSVAESPRKPKLVYLKRDHNDKFGFGDYHSLNDYIQKDKAWKWLHDMNLFRSIHGYQIEQRPSRDIGFPTDTINKLVAFLFDLTPTSQRFVENDYELNKQLSLINKIGRIDSGMEKIHKNFILRGLLFDDDKTIKCGQVLSYAEFFKWNANDVEKAFNKTDHEILQKMVNDGLIEEHIRIKLMVNKDTVIERINKMNDADREEMDISNKSLAIGSVVVGFITIAVIGGIRVLAR